jgi:hypothetical protein
MKAQPEVAAFDVNPPAITGPDIKFFTAIHRFPSENRPRRNEEREGKTEEIFVFFASSWLIFIT